MSRRAWWAVGLGALALITAAAVTTVALRGGSERASQGAASRTSPAPQARPRGTWIAEANAVCSLGRKLYPSIALGAYADPDTVDYGVHRLVGEIAAVSVPAPVGVRRLRRHGRAAESAWRSLATRPIGDLTFGERTHAERLTTRYVDELVALGANACAPLRPAA